MNKACIPAVEIGTVATAPPDDPRRRHLVSCPRCRALAREYDAFMNPAPLPAAAHTEWAATALSRRLAQEIGTPGGVIVPLRPRKPRFAVPPRALWAAAAVLVACAGLVLVRDLADELNPRVPPGPAILRGKADAPLALTVTSVAGGWHLAWASPAGADANVVVLYDAALRELGRRDLGPRTFLTFDPRAWPEATSAAYVGVVFLTGGDEVGRTSAHALAAD